MEGTPRHSGRKEDGQTDPVESKEVPEVDFDKTKTSPRFTPVDKRRDGNSQPPTGLMIRVSSR